jgi:hypothetical protein
MDQLGDDTQPLSHLSRPTTTGFFPKDPLICALVQLDWSGTKNLDYPRSGSA